MSESAHTSAFISITSRMCIVLQTNIYESDRSWTLYYDQCDHKVRLNFFFFFNIEMVLKVCFFYFKDGLDFVSFDDTPELEIRNQKIGNQNRPHTKFLFL